MLVNRLRTLALKANDIQSNDIVDLDADEELKKLLSEYVQLLLNTDNNYENATNNLLQPAVMKGTMQMTNGYVGSFWAVALYNILTQQILSISGPECPGIHNVECVIQKILKLESITDESGNKVVWSKLNDNFNYNSRSHQLLLNEMDYVLSAERQLGVKHTGFRQHSTFNNGTLRLALDEYVAKQFVPGSFFLTVNTLKDYGNKTTGTKSKLTFDRAKYNELRPKIAELAKQVNEESGFTVTVTQPDGTVLADKQPVLGTIYEFLWMGHAVTAIIGKEIQDGNTPKEIDYTKGTLVQQLLVSAASLIPPMYFESPELEEMGAYLLANGATWISAFSSAVNTAANKNLESLGINPSTHNKSSDANSSGYTITIPTDSEAYPRVVDSFPSA